MDLFKRLKELRAKKNKYTEEIRNLVSEIRSLASEEKEDEARVKSIEKERIEARMEVVDEEIQNVMDAIEENRNSNPVPNFIKNDDKTETRKLQLSAMAKTVRGRELNEEERNVMSSTNNGAIIPQEFVSEFEKLKQGYPSIKQYCHVIPVVSNAGKMPVRAGSTINKLANLVEDQELVKAMLSTKPLAYDIDDYGLLAPIDNSLLEDSEINFLEFVNEEFAEFAVNTENDAIIKKLNPLLTKETVKSHEGIVKAINKLAPNARKRAVIITNNLGRAYLDGLMDKQGRPLLKELSDGGDLVFKGRPVLEIDETIYDTSGKIILLIVDVKTLIKFFDRKQYIIDSSKEAGYTKNQTVARIIYRFDINSPDIDAELIRKFGVAIEVTDSEEEQII